MSKIPLTFHGVSTVPMHLRANAIDQAVGAGLVRENAYGSGAPPHFAQGPI